MSALYNPRSLIGFRRKVCAFPPPNSISFTLPGPGVSLRWLDLSGSRPFKGRLRGRLTPNLYEYDPHEGPDPVLSTTVHPATTNSSNGPSRFQGQQKRTTVLDQTRLRANIET